ncbi:hypothetical protein [Ciceribacter ferrooxidans]|nr:hypothetical protein [Ciceribacter ferrooxidans]
MSAVIQGGVIVEIGRRFIGFMVLDGGDYNVRLQTTLESAEVVA